MPSAKSHNRGSSIAPAAHVSNVKEPNRRCEPTGRANARPMTAKHKERLDCFASLAMTAKHDFAISRLVCPRFAKNFPNSPNQRAQGMPGARCTRSLACKIKIAYEHSHHGHTGFTRHSPRNGLRLITRSPRCAGFLATVACASYRRLDLSVDRSRTTRLCRPQDSAFVVGAARVHRIPSRVDDVAQRPSCRDGMGSHMA